MSKLLLELSSVEKSKKKAKLLEKLQKLEDLTDSMEEQIATFLVKLSEERLSLEESADIKGMIDIITDLERIADIILRMGRDIERLDKKGLQFNEAQKTNLNEMSGKVDEALLIMLENLNGAKSKITLDLARMKEDEINKLRKELRKNQMKLVGEPGYEVSSGIVYRDIYSGYEKLGDHIINVSEGIVGEKLDLN